MNYCFFISEDESECQFDYYKDLYDEPECSFKVEWGGSCYFMKLLRRIVRILGKILKCDFIRTINFSKRDIKRINDNEQYCLIFTLAYFVRCFDIALFETLGNKNNVKLMLLLNDSVDSSSGVMLDAKAKKVFSLKWDRILSFDEKDCEKYGWKYTGCLYSSRAGVRPSMDINDAYFIGKFTPDRENLILGVFNKLNRAGVKCRFDLWVPDKRKADLANGGKGIHYRRFYLKYKKMLRYVRSSNCIIEVQKKGQNSPTLRWFEAIYFNKKLLTNNPNITKLPFYNPDYMKFYASPEEIDVDWVRREEAVNYKYNGELSQKRLLSFISEK